MKLKILIGVLILSALTGCSTITRWFSSEQAMSTQLDDREIESKRNQRIKAAYERREIALGQDMQQVADIWGEPRTVQIAGNRAAGNQKWVYYLGLSSRWSMSDTRAVYFENGRVVGWTTR